MPTMTIPVPLPGIGPVDVRVDEYGSGQPFLLLHGGAGPQSMLAFGELMAARSGVRAIVASHPGFGGASRPEGLSSIAGLARLYLGLIDQLGLSGVTVVGSSIGGWIAAELALLRPPSVSGIVLIDAVGIEVPGHPVAGFGDAPGAEQARNFFTLSLDEIFALSYHDPEPFRFDPASLSPAAQAVAAGNRAALATYGGLTMTDPTLATRLAGLEVPTLVLWGASDRIVDVDYGRAYAAAIPGARFQVLPETGHLPQLETPEQTLDAIRAAAP